MKRFRQFFVCVLLTVSFNVAAVTNFEVDGIGYSSEDGKYATIVSVKDKDYEGEVTIPVVVNYDGKTYGVKTIGDNACKGRTGITKVTISNGITSIGVSAFDDCTNLQSVILPNSLLEIGVIAFLNCKSLLKIDIPNSVTSIGGGAFRECTNLSDPIVLPSGLQYVMDGTFEGCKNITSIEIPENVSYIGIAAFNRCDKLESVIMHNGVSVIGSSAFSYCESLSSIFIPENVESIAPTAFSYCTNLTSISVHAENKTYNSLGNCNAIIETGSNKLVCGCKNTIIPEGVLSIGNRAFEGCEGLYSFVITNGVVSIGENAFFACSNLSSIVIPTSVNEIKWAAFGDCSSITDITIPEHVSKIAYELFKNCVNLKNVDIPSGVSEIGGSAFSNCTGLKRIICRANVPPTITSNDVFENVGSDVEVYVPCASLVDYMIADGWNYFDSSNFKCIEDLVNVEESSSESIKEAISVSEKVITVNGVDSSDISIYNTAGQPVSNPVPTSGVYIVKVGDETIKVLVK